MYLGSCYSKGKSHHSEKDGNNGQVRVRVRGFVSPTGYLSIEGRGVDGSGMCNLEVFSQKGDICWKYTMVYHKESPNRMGQYIWSWSVVNGGHYFSRDGKNFTDTAFPT